MNKLTVLLFAALIAFALPAGAQSPYETTARELLANFTAGRFDAATKDFNDSMRATAPAGILKAMSEQLESQVGAFRSITELHELREGGSLVIELMAAYEKSVVSVRVVFDRSYRVGAVFFNPVVAHPVDPALERMARELLGNVTAGRFEAAAEHFGENMRKELPPPKLEELARNLTRTFGRFRSVREVRQKTEPPHRIIELMAVYDKSPVSVSVVYDSKDFVTGVHITPVAK